MNQPNRRAIITFIKNPVLGKVKTRLARTVGDENALRIYRALLSHTRSIVCQIEAKRFVFYDTYVNDHDDWSPTYFQKEQQSSGDLGTRMKVAFQKVLKTHDQVIIVGSDCASITVKIIEKAFNVLGEKDIVIGPAFDGGYYLLGMKTLHPFLFEKMPWSTERVFCETTNRIQKANLSYGVVEALSDIDYEEDWKKYGWKLPD